MEVYIVTNSLNQILAVTKTLDQAKHALWAPLEWVEGDVTGYWDTSDGEYHISEWPVMNSNFYDWKK